MHNMLQMCIQAMHHPLFKDPFLVRHRVLLLSASLSCALPLAIHWLPAALALYGHIIACCTMRHNSVGNECRTPIGHDVTASGRVHGVLVYTCLVTTGAVGFTGPGSPVVVWMACRQLAGNKTMSAVHLLVVVPAMFVTSGVCQLRLRKHDCNIEQERTVGAVSHFVPVRSRFAQ